MITKICKWCKKEFEPKHGNQQYCDEHKEVAKKDKTRLRRLKFYHINKRSENNKQLGTTSLGPHPDSNILIEIGKIKNALEKISVTGKGKTKRKKFGKSNNIWIDYDGKMEYGHVQPLGIQQTHKNASFDDYVNTSITYKLQNRPECPECGCTVHIKNLKHINISCSDCGLVLESGDGLMSTTHTDKLNSTNQRDLQDIGWKMYWVQQAFLEDKFRKVSQ